MDHPAWPGIRHYYRDCIGLALDELGLPASAVPQGYLGALLARYAFRIDVTPATVAGHLAEIQRCWRPGDPAFDPRREVRLRQDLGDATLFLTGFLWERVGHRNLRRSLIRLGRGAYRFLAEYHRAAGRPPAAAVFAALDRNFPRHSALLMYLREAHLDAAGAAERAHALTDREGWGAR